MNKSSLARCRATAIKIIQSIWLGAALILVVGLPTEIAQADYRDAEYCSSLSRNAFSCERDSRCFFSDEIRACVARDLDCSQFRFNQSTCNRIAGCEWDYRFNTCALDPRVPNDGGGSQCRDYDRDPRGCDATWGCEWDSFSRSCSDQGNNPWPGQQCSRLNNNPRQCDSTPGCRYDSWNRQCERDGSGGGHNGNRVVIPCSTHNSQMQTCHVGGTVISARLLRQFGNSYCREGSSWGRSSNGVWVSNGCSGEFELVIRRHN